MGAVENRVTMGDTQIVGLHKDCDDGHLVAADFHENPVLGIDSQADPHRLAALILARIDDAFNLAIGLNAGLEKGADFAGAASGPLLNSIGEIKRMQAVLTDRLERDDG